MRKWPLVCLTTGAAGLAALLLVVAAHGSRVSYGRASVYGPGLYGNPVACGGRSLSRWTLGVAHRWLPCGTKIRLYSRSGNYLTVRVIDRGPYAGGRDLDLTEYTAWKICGCSWQTWGVRTIRYRTMP